MSSALQVLTAGTVFGSVLQYRQTVAQGKVQQRIAEAEARNRRLEGRVEAVKAKESANEILRRTKRALASNIARGYSSGVIPEVGSSAVFSEQQVLRPAALDVGILEQDAFLAIEQSQRQARNIEYQGQMAARQAKTEALFKLGTDLAQIAMTGVGSGSRSVAPNIAQPGTPGNLSQINVGGGAFPTAGGGMNFRQPQGISFL